MKLESLIVLSLTFTALDGSIAISQEQPYRHPYGPPPLSPSDGWSYRYEPQPTSGPQAPSAPLPAYSALSPESSPPPPLASPPSLATAPAHDRWELSAVQEEGRPRLLVKTGRGMQAITASLTFQVAGPQGPVTYAAAAAKQVQVKGGSFQGSADRIIREANGSRLRLEGSVRVHWQRGGGAVELTAPHAVVDLQSGHVATDLDAPQPPKTWPEYSHPF